MLKKACSGEKKLFAVVFVKIADVEEFKSNWEGKNLFTRVKFVVKFKGEIEKSFLAKKDANFKRA